MAELNRITVDDFKSVEKNPLVVVLDNIRSLNNIGSVFRTSDAFRVQSIYLCGITGTPPNKEIHKTALGATESVDWQYFENTEDAVRELQSKKFRVYAVEQAFGSVMLNNFTVEENTPIAVVFGNEVNGVREDVMNLVDGCIEIPQFGTKHSLNVSVSIGVVLWEVCHQNFRLFNK